MKGFVSKKQTAQEGILLETGTNEFELIEFILEDHSYGINVAKIREVIEFPEHIYPVPKTHPCLEGVTSIRNEIISIINLKKFLSLKDDETTKKKKVIITEFNNLKMGFVVDFVTRIYRLSWDKVSAPDRTLTGKNAYITSIVKLVDKIILMLDFEKIVMEVNQSTMNEGDISKVQVDFDRSIFKVLIAEDSETVRTMMLKNLAQAGYQVVECTNGMEAYDKIKELGKNVDLVITDIEMPQMDGYTLCRKIKEDRRLNQIPVTIFSSLISPDIRKKGESVGADAQITKPDLHHLIEIVDELIRQYVIKRAK